MKFLPEEGAELLIGGSHLRHSKSVADDRKHGSVDPVTVSRIPHIPEEFSGKALNHTVTEVIAVQLVDLAEPADAQKGNVDRRIPLEKAVQIIEETVLIPEAGQGIQVALLSCAHLTDLQREEEMQKAASYGVPIVLGTIGEDGSYALVNGKFFFANAVHADDVIDTMGAGDSYFATFLCSLLKASRNGKLLEGTDAEMEKRIEKAMNDGAVFAARVCAMEGAFGYGTPILGKTEV
jgi:hypothetical protein